MNRYPHRTLHTEPGKASQQRPGSVPGVLTLAGRVLLPLSLNTPHPTGRIFKDTIC